MNRSWKKIERLLRFDCLKKSKIPNLIHGKRKQAGERIRQLQREAMGKG